MPRGGPAGPEEKEEEEAAATAAACMEDEDDEDEGNAVVGVRLAADTAVRQVPVTSIGCYVCVDGCGDVSVLKP